MEVSNFHPLERLEVLSFDHPNEGHLTTEKVT